jgi:hypothetical protein
MRELNEVEVEEVNGAGNGGAIALTLAGAWAGAVTCGAIGSIVPGVGTVAGIAVGFVVGGAIGVAATFATAQPGVAPPP